MEKTDMILILLLITFGAANTIILSMQNIQTNDQGTKFFHPFMQCALMFFGEMICFVAYFAIRNRNKEQEKDKPKPALYLLIFPALMDTLSSTLAYVALHMVPSSVWQISRGGVIITTALLSKIFLKKTFTKSMIFGCGLALLGITTVQLVNVFSSDGSEGSETLFQIIGIVLLLVSIFFNGLQFCFQKWLFDRYELHPLKLVYIEGLFGFVIVMCLNFGLQFIQCPWNDYSKCVQVNDEYFIQNISLFFHQIITNITLLLLSIGLIFSIAISVSIAVTITKRINPISRSLADVTRTSLVWLFGIILTVTVGQSQSKYAIQDTRIWVNLIKAFGFGLLILGTMLYHNLLPCFNKKQKEHRDSLLFSDIANQRPSSSIRTSESLI